MATSSMIPYSNPAGRNQTAPGGGYKTPQPLATVPTSSPLAGPTDTTQQNPFIPATASSSGAAPNTAAAQGFITNNSSYSSGENDLQKQLLDIYGKGIGGSLYDLLNNMSGTNSTILQEYIQSLVPQEAKAQANLNSSLGASGVSGNSSVAALGNANLQAQEFADISGESASLTQNQENLTAQLLTGMSGAASKEVATSGWSTFGNVMGAITGDIGALVGGGSPDTSFGSGYGGFTPDTISGSGGSFSIPQSDFSSTGPQTISDTLEGLTI